jgi:hypothetical protein
VSTCPCAKCTMRQTRLLEEGAMLVGERGSGRHLEDGEGVRGNGGNWSESMRTRSGCTVSVRKQICVKLVSCSLPIVPHPHPL